MEGYTRLAALMERQKDLQIVRRYQNLRTIRILHLSAEIQDLQDSLGLLVAEDRRSDIAEKKSIESHYASMMASRTDSTGVQQIHLWDTLTEKLQQYGDLLLQTHALSQLPPANTKSLHHLRDWLHDKHGGSSFLRGAEADVWADAWTSDLTSLIASPAGNDAFTRFTTSILIPLYHKLRGHRHRPRISIRDPYTGDGQLEMPLHDYPDAWILGLVDAISAMLASLLPALGALVLFLLEGMRQRMLAIVAMTCLFSAVLTCLARVRRVDVFVAVSAFAAVLVVFVGNDCQDGGRGS